MVTLATNLSTNETTVKVSSMEELVRMIKLVGEYNLFVWAPFNEWMTVGEWTSNGNDLNGLFI